MKSYYNLHPIVPEKYHRNNFLTGTYPNQDRILFHQCTIVQIRQGTFGLWRTSLTNACNHFRDQRKSQKSIIWKSSFKIEQTEARQFNKRIKLNPRIINCIIGDVGGFLACFLFVCFVCLFFLSTVNSEPLEQSKNHFPLEFSVILLEVFQMEVLTMN